MRSRLQLNFPIVTIHDREFNLTEITYNPDNHSLYVISPGPNKASHDVKKYEILVITSDGKLVKHIPIPNDARRIAYNPSNSLVYVSSDDYLFLINSSSNQIIKKIQNFNVFDLAYNSNNKFMYVTHFEDSSVSVINSSSNEVIKNITGVEDLQPFIVYNPDNKFMYVTHLDGSVSVINSSSNEIIKNITGVGKSPKGILYNPDNKFLYVYSKGSPSSRAFISIINSSSNEVIKNITNIGPQPIDSCLQPRQ